MIINSQELSKYFGADKSPREMKDTILKLLDEYKAKNAPELGKPDRKKERQYAELYPDLCQDEKLLWD